MLQTMNRYEFIGAFKQSNERKGQFSREALSALFDYLEECHRDDALVFDLVAICCEWEEFKTFNEVSQDYGYKTLDELESNTIVIRFNHGYLVHSH